VPWPLQGSLAAAECLDVVLDYAGTASIRESPWMPVSSSFKTFILEQLGRRVRGIRGRNMFGGVGIYGGEFFFALIADDTLYFKVDESNRPDFEARGMGPFRPSREHRDVMQYYRVPDDLLEDDEALGQWAEKAVVVARRARSRTPRPGSLT
jgi:DNA transformation protein and related proteins